MNNTNTLTAQELVRFFMSKEKRADLNKVDSADNTPNGLMQEDITVEPLEEEENEDTFDFLKRMLVRSSEKVTESKEELGEQLAAIKEKALANIDTIKNTQLKSKPNPFIGGPLSPMLTEAGVEQEVEKFVDPMLRDPDLLEIPTETFDETDKQTEEALTDAEIADIDSSAIDDVGEAQDNQPNLDDVPTGGLMSRPKARPDLFSPDETAKIKGVQKYLEITVDGDFGPGTSRALAAFQYKNNIPVSGQVDDETIKAMQNPDTLDPREATIKVNDVLNADGTRPDIEKLKAWSKKNIKDPMRAAAFVATVEAESGTGLVEVGHDIESAVRVFVTDNKYMHVDNDVDKPLTAKGKRRKQKIEALGSTASGDEIFDFIYGTDADAIGSKLGNTQAGDGSTFKGRGLIQLSGRDNYKKVGDILGLDLVSSPELVNDPKHAVAVAMAYLTLPNKNFFLNRMNPENGVSETIDGLTSEKLAQVVGHSGGTTVADARFRRANALREEMYN